MASVLTLLTGADFDASLACMADSRCVLTRFMVQDCAKLASFAFELRKFACGQQELN